MCSKRQTQVILITGASSGIGEGLARALAARGDRLGLVARRAEDLERLAGEIAQTGGSAIALPGDVRNADSIRQAVAQIQEAYGGLHVLVANAGILVRKPIAEQTLEELQRVIEINLLGAITTIHVALESFLAQGSGHVVGITSLAGYAGLPNNGTYSASKAGLSTFLESLRVEIGGRGIHVTDVRPGYIATDMTSDNPGRMPQLLTIENAVRRIVRAIDRPRPYVHFPAPTSWTARASRLLPRWIYDRAVRRTLRGTGR